MPGVFFAFMDERPAEHEPVMPAARGWIGPRGPRAGSGAQDVRGKSVVVGLDHAIASNSMTLHQLCGVGERYTLAVDHEVTPSGRAKLFARTWPIDVLGAGI